MVDQAAPQQEDTRAGQEASEAARAVCLAASADPDRDAQVGKEAAALAVGRAAASILAAVPQEAKDGQTTSAAAALVADQAAAASDQVVQEVQVDLCIQEFLEAQVGQTVLEDKVAVHHPLPRLTERAPRESRREHHATQPSTLCSRNSSTRSSPASCGRAASQLDLVSSRTGCKRLPLTSEGTTNASTGIGDAW